MSNNMQKMADTVKSGYQKIEDGVVDGYKAIEENMVNGFTRISDAFVKKFLMHEGETLEEAKARIAREEEALHEKSKEHIKNNTNI